MIEIRNVVVRDIGEVWVLEWENRRSGECWKWCSRELVAINTAEEAVQDAVDYFGVLVRKEDVTVC